MLSYVSLEGKIRKLIMCALVASGTGDVFLALDIEHSFLLGLGAFLISHIIYVVSFSHLKLPNATAARKGITVAVLIYAALMASYLLPDTGELMIPVLLYLLVITCMAATALLFNLHKLVVLGALVFVCSDSLLALSVFKTPVPFSTYWVMFTYYSAQFLIITGVIAHVSQESNHRFSGELQTG